MSTLLSTTLSERALSVLRGCGLPVVIGLLAVVGIVVVAYGGVYLVSHWCSPWYCGLENSCRQGEAR